MCIAFWGYEAFPAFPTLKFLLAFGRDEFLARPTEAAHFWQAAPGCPVLGGRDLQAGGTWMGITAAGRIAFLTNLRECDPEGPLTHQGPNHHISRGSLISNFLTGKDTPQQYAQAISKDLYHGFNLVIGDLRSGQLVYTANPLDQPGSPTVEPCSSNNNNHPDQGIHHPDQMPSILIGGQGHEGELHNRSVLRSAGSFQQEVDIRRRVLTEPVILERHRLYGVSNGLLNEWPKVEAGVQDLEALLNSKIWNQPESCSGTQDNSYKGSHQLPWESILTDVLGNNIKDESLKGTNGEYAHSTKYVCSSRFIDAVELEEYGLYGTRSQMILAIWEDGTVELRERNLNTDLMIWENAIHRFTLQN